MGLETANSSYMQPTEQPSVVKSADRVLDLLELLADWESGMGHTEMAAALEIPKSSLSQLLKNLIARGYVDYEGNSRLYRLGQSFLNLPQRATRTPNLIASVEPMLVSLVDVTGESCALNVLKGDEVEVVATISSSHRLVSHLRKGDLAPLYAVSGGKAILAFLPAETSREYIERATFTRITTKTIRSKAALRSELARIKAEGVAYSFEEFTPGIVGIGVPIVSPAGMAVASLNVAMPAVRYSEEVRVRVVQALAEVRSKLERSFMSRTPGIVSDPG